MIRYTKWSPRSIHRVSEYTVIAAYSYGMAPPTTVDTHARTQGAPPGGRRRSRHVHIYTNRGTPSALIARVCCKRTYDVSCTHYLGGRCPRVLSGLDPGRHHASRYHGVHALPRDPVPPQPVTMHTQRTVEQCLSEYTRPSRNRSEALIMGFTARGRTAQ